jgi:hypothetical protein
MTITILEEVHEECCCVTGPETGDFSKNDYLLG